MILNVLSDSNNSEYNYNFGTAGGYRLQNLFLSESHVLFVLSHLFMAWLMLILLRKQN